MKEYETIIGLEVHVQLKTNSKIFCSCPNDFSSSANTNICPICCGYPGVLPVLNKKALLLGLRAALALNCKINRRIYFERKNYFYPDLPKNYQISQYEKPLGEDGFLLLPSGRSIGIKRVHLEEDAGKLIHKGNTSFVDFNRAGAPLLEIVSLPQINSPQEAFDYLTYLKLTLQYIDASSCDMEKGFLRCDANISLREKGKETLGTKVELKNMNTFKGIKEALEYEVRRQNDRLCRGEKIFQETRLWDEGKGITVVMRTKEGSSDYRYFPEPDLRNFTITEEMIEEEKKNIPLLPVARGKKLFNLGLSEKEISVLLSYKYLVDFFDEVLSFYSEPKDVANWILGPFLREVNLLGGDFSRVKITPKNFSLIVKYFKEGKLNNIKAKELLALALKDGGDVEKLIQEKGFLQATSESDLSKLIEEVIQENPKPTEEYRRGKQQAIMFLVGQIMRKTKARADPKLARKLLEEKLS